MIHLKDLLAEITMGSMTPYATQFTWRRDTVLQQTWYESEFFIDEHEVGIELIPVRTQPDEREYIFQFTMPDTFGSKSYSHGLSAAAGQVPYVRLIATVGEALLDFCTQYAPTAVDVSGGDADLAMKQKKTRIYAAFLRDNATRLATAGYTSLMRGDNLWIVRKSTADATGIRETP